jgi:integrase
MAASAAFAMSAATALRRSPIDRARRELTVKSWNRVFRKIVATADRPIEGGHPHRFRGTFAVTLLNGVDPSHISILVGHASIKLTERHYAPWVEARQKQLEEECSDSFPSNSASSTSYAPFQSLKTPATLKTRV